LSLQVREKELTCGLKSDSTCGLKSDSSKP